MFMFWWGLCNRFAAARVAARVATERSPLSRIPGRGSDSRAGIGRSLGGESRPPRLTPRFSTFAEIPPRESRRESRESEIIGEIRPEYE
jgi:hypothetical protein